ncbi:Jag N-terminal domain-containing protein, partial [Peribacillus acanthi]|uniref:Jag N-terminal domain-containing protein n=1 Tax=Peribacillus acanthi TaxID=2171554 RepID=UPI001F0C71BE
MEQSVLSKGKDILEAIEIGLGVLGTNKEGVSIEVIQKETKGLWKLGSKEAIVKLTKIQGRNDLLPPQLSIEVEEDVILGLLEDMVLTPELQGEIKDVREEELQEDEEQSSDRDGKVWIKDGFIQCKPSPLHYPTITIGKGVKLLKNGEEVHGTMVVTKEDSFEIQTEEIEMAPQWQVSMDENRLNVFLYVEPGKKITHRVKDVDPDFHIVLESEEIVEIITGLGYKDILSHLESIGIAQGFNHGEIMRAVNTELPGRFTIARGTEPTKGENGKVELVVNVQKKSGPKERSDG